MRNRISFPALECFMGGTCPDLVRPSVRPAVPDKQCYMGDLKSGIDKKSVRGSADRVVNTLCWIFCMAHKTRAPLWGP